MAVNIEVPTLGESVTEATVAKWFKQVGDAVEADEPLLELETDKVTLEVNAPSAGALSEIAVEEGGEVEVGAILGKIEEGASGKKGGGDGKDEKKDDAKDEKKEEKAEAKDTDEKKSDKKDDGGKKDDGDKKSDGDDSGKDRDAGDHGPAVRKMLEENDVDPSDVKGTGKDGRITKEDVQAFLDGGGKKEKSDSKQESRASKDAGPREERVKMTRLRKRIAERLKEAQNTAAMLTTFNEVDMTNLLAVRGQYKEAFEKKHGTKLGFMSFFAKASVVGLKELPAVNAEIDGDEIVYKNHYDVGIAVSTPNGLVVPVVRDCDEKSFAEIEASIVDMGTRARDGKLGIDEMTGGTFTITNGGVFGSLLSTPILNPPQSAILGMHKTQPRPVAIGDKVEVRPMMYLALSYDHRIVDGREAVTFLVRVKECIEDPQRILLDM